MVPNRRAKRTMKPCASAGQLVVHPADLETVSRWLKSGDEDRPRDSQVRVRTADGTYRWHMVRRVPIREDGTIVGWFSSATDIDEQRRALEREQRVAQELQAAIFSPQLPEVDGVVLDGKYQPASLHARVGGDWYDVIALDDGRVAFSIGDVVGHGLEAASKMLRLREALRVAARLAGATPEEVIAAGEPFAARSRPRRPRCCDLRRARSGRRRRVVRRRRYALAGRHP